MSALQERIDTTALLAERREGDLSTPSAAEAGGRAGAGSEDRTLGDGGREYIVVVVSSGR